MGKFHTQVIKQVIFKGDLTDITKPLLLSTATFTQSLKIQ